jgi:hypothetical protein
MRSLPEAFSGLLLLVGSKDRRCLDECHAQRPEFRNAEPAFELCLSVARGGEDRQLELDPAIGEADHRASSAAERKS